MNYKILLPVFISCFMFNIQLQSQQEEGYIDVNGGKIWYCKIGSGMGTPLIAIHGGPGGRSCGNIIPMRELAKDRPVILFDQLESGKSDRPNDTTLWKMEFFLDQVDSVRKVLELNECHLLGSSWGGAIVAEYMITRNTKGVKSAVFSSPLISTPRWLEDARVLLSRLPRNIQDTINKYETLGDYNSQTYWDAVDVFYNNYLIRKSERAVTLLKPCEDINGFNSIIYNYMWGPTEFTATGTLKNFNRLDDLHKIKVPVLFVAGEYDEVLPETISLFQSKIKGSETAIIPESGHATIVDNTKVYIKTLREFLNDVDSHDK